MHPARQDGDPKPPAPAGRPGAGGARPFPGRWLSGWRIAEGAVAAPGEGWRRVWDDGLATTTFRARDRRALLMQFAGAVRAEIDLDARTVRATPLGPWVTAATVDHFVHDQVLPRLIAGPRRLVLHGALVHREGRAVALTGPSGAGKSTLSAWLSRSGWSLAGDDAAVLERAPGGWSAGAAHPSLRLLPDSAAALFADAGGPAGAAGHGGKTSLHRATDAAPGGLRLVAVLRLDRAAGTVRARLPGRDACMALVENAFRLDPSDPASAADTLCLAAGIAGSVPCLGLGYPRRYDALPDAAAAIGQVLDEAAP